MSEEKLDRIIEGVAKIDERTANLKEYIQAVSANQKDTAAKLDIHIANNDTAHGAGVREKAAKNWSGWIGWAFTALLSLAKIKEILAHGF